MDRLYKRIILGTIALSIFVAGCTVQYSLSGASISPEVETVSIEYFPNHAPINKPGLSQDIVDALEEKIRSQTSLRVVNKQGDVQFQGEITDYGTEPVSIQANERAAQNRLTISLKVSYQNQINPEKSFEQNFSQSEDYPSNQSLSDVEDELSADIVEKLIQSIFNAAFVNW